jgi:hypothetical protein
MCEICVFRLQARLICHGWVTPAARDARRSFAVKSDICGARTHVHKSGGCQPAVVLCYERWAVRIEDCAATGEHPTKSGGRQPAVGVVGRTLSVMWWKRTCKRVCETTGGPTPPAPALLCECPPAKNDFCDAQTHVHKSGGCQPAVVWESRLRGQLRPHSETIVGRQLKSGGRQPAVGTSNAIGRADVFVRRHARQPAVAR